jgi:hypothetical protein
MKYSQRNAEQKHKSDTEFAKEPRTNQKNMNVSNKPKNPK